MLHTRPAANGRPKLSGMSARRIFRIVDTEVFVADTDFPTTETVFITDTEFRIADVQVVSTISHRICR